MSDDAVDAVVVGAGPNGLAAAIALAQAGHSVQVLEASDEPGGGARSAELTLPGLQHDVCSAALPFAVASPFLASLPLEEHGLSWAYPPVPLAHPLDSGRAAVLHRSLSQTAAGLGADGYAWRRTFGPLAKRFDAITNDVLGPLVSIPRHPVTLARFGLRALLPATTLARRFSTDEARALWAGSAAHAFHRLNRPAMASVGMMLTLAGHRVDWPVARGGSQALTRTLVDLLTSYGGTVTTGVRVQRLADLPPARVKLFDTTPSGLAAIVGDKLPRRTLRAYQRFRPGPAAFKVDLAVEDGINWTASACRRAGTVHAGGTLEEIAAAEADVVRGRMPERPFVLVGQQYLADESRSSGNIHPVWAYAHVPAGYDGDATEALLDQLERFAPGTRERIVGSHVMRPAELEAYNPNYIAGDIAGGANNLRQLVSRPRLLHPYDTGLPGFYLCSASTPPGGGVHGMSGYHAAQRALRFLRRRQRPTIESTSP